MSVSKKQSISLVSYNMSGQAEMRQKKQAGGYAIWPTRGKIMQAYISTTLGLWNMVQFAAASAIYGGIIWVPYIILAVTVGVPLITVEITVAHYVNGDIKNMWRMCPIGSGIFWNSFAVTLVSLLFSLVYLSYLLHFAIDAEQLNLSESKTIGGLASTVCNATYLNMSDTAYGKPCPRQWLDISFFKEYYAMNDIYYIPDNRRWFQIIYQGILCFTALIINCKGVHSIEKFTAFLVLLPYLCAVIFLILILTLPKSISHINACFYIKWSQIGMLEVWLLSFRHVVVGFSIGSLSIPFVAVHSDFHDDIMVDVVIIFLTHFTGTMLFSSTVLGLMGTLTSGSMLEAEKPPPNDYLSVLLWLIQGLEFLPPPKGFWSFLFLASLTVSEIGVQTFMFAAVIDSIIAVVPKIRGNSFYVVVALSLILFLTGISLICFKVMKLPTLITSFIAIGLFQSILVFWIYNYQKVCADFHFLMGYKPSLFLQSMWVVSPLIFGIFLSLTILTQTSIDIMLNNALILTILHLFIFTGSGIFEAYRLWNKKENYNIFKTNKSWGPSDPVLKKSREIFKSRIITKEHIYRQKLYKKQLAKPFDITDQNIVQLL